jgi:hypothetical protein
MTMAGVMMEETSSVANCGQSLPIPGSRGHARRACPTREYRRVFPFRFGDSGMVASPLVMSATPRTCRVTVHNICKVWQAQHRWWLWPSPVAARIIHTDQGRTGNAGGAGQIGRRLTRSHDNDRQGPSRAEPVIHGMHRAGLAEAHSRTALASSCIETRGARPPTTSIS